MSQLDSHNRHQSPLPDSTQIERAFDTAWAAITALDYESDEELEAALRRELIGIARDNGLEDAQTLRDLVLALLSRERDEVGGSSSPVSL
jgi:hypothetical protein